MHAAQAQIDLSFMPFEEHLQGATHQASISCKEVVACSLEIVVNAKQPKNKSQLLLIKQPTLQENDLV